VTADLPSTLLPTPWVSSWFGRARPADLFDPDPARRASAWAHWALSSLAAMTGNSDRPYYALTLTGRFYDPRGTGPTVRPHLEIPAAVLQRPDPTFPDRLAQAGNALEFPWWIVPEVLAVKRALFAAGSGSVADLVDLLNDRRPALVDALAPLATRAGSGWEEIEALQVSDPEALSQTATAPFETDEIAQYLPPAVDLGLRVEFDRKLAESNRAFAARRVGVWRITGNTGSEPFTLGVVTPRLTRSSLFSDRLFTPDREAPAALLVRGLLLRRLLATHLGSDVSGHTVRNQASRTTPTGPRLRAVVAKVGEKLPEASVPSAVHFLQRYPDASDAWAVLTEWATTRPDGADGRRAVLTVTEEGFKAAHRSALRALRRAEEPNRDDINVLLPLAWDSRSRVVRVTFARPTETD
jgi:hypothetical protein